MPPRRSAGKKNLPMIVGSPFESIASRLKRLRPDDPQDPPVVPDTRGTPVPRVATPPKAAIPGRSDALQYGTCGVGQRRMQLLQLRLLVWPLWWRTWFRTALHSRASGRRPHS